MSILYMLLAAAGLVISFVLLVKGADYFVDGCVSIARLLRVPNLIIGLTIVAMGTSAPEAAVSISGAITDPTNAGITVGNLFGSNMLNILVILGVSAVIVPVGVDRSLLKKDFPLLIGSAVIVPLLFWLFDFRGTRLAGCIVLTFFAVFMVWTIMNALSSRKRTQFAEMVADDSDEVSDNEPMSKLKSILYAVCGLAVVIGGGQLAVYCAKYIAQGIGISDTLIGLTVVALGTSLPELITSVVAARKGNSDLALGNVIGSNLFNVLLVLGLSMLIAPFSVSMENMIDAICVLATSIVCYIAAGTKKIGRVWGIVFLLLYAAYLTYIIYRDVVLK
ncbi:MAG: calcium/sodium antiporter [Ruminococcus sp.]